MAGAAVPASSCGECRDAGQDGGAKSGEGVSVEEEGYQRVYCYVENALPRADGS